MKKRYIVKDNKTFSKIINTCSYVKDNYLVIYYCNNDCLFNRYGISVPVKLGKAHIRNKLKRQMRMIIHNSKNNFKNNRDYIIIFRKNCIGGFEDYYKSYNKLCEIIRFREESNEKK